MPTQKQRIAEYNRRIRELGICYDIEASDPDLYHDLLEIVRNHKEWKERSEGVIGLSIHEHSMSRAVCLHLNYADGKVDPISVKSCVSGLGWTPNRTISATMRVEVADQVMAHIRSNPKCIKCGSTCAVQADHCGEMEFRHLKDAFVKEHGILASHCHKNEYKQPAFIDRELAKKWQEYHLENAVLQSLCKPCHDRKTFGRKS